MVKKITSKQCFGDWAGVENEKRVKISIQRERCVDGDHR